MTQQAYAAAKHIQSITKDFKPKLALILGSGQSELITCIDNAIHIPYSELPGFPAHALRGHGRQLTLGTVAGLPVVALQGRGHTYETGDYDSVKTYIRTLKLLGIDTMLATNASGSFHSEMGPGELVLVSDHMNFQGSNPLVGPNDEDFGPRFPAMDNIYDHELRKQLQQCANQHDLHLHEGVYCCVMGPCYETAAEISAFRILGADVIGMSTVPEVIVARHCGLKIAVIASVTNLVTGMAKHSHDHEAVVKMAQNASDKLKTIVTEFASQLGAA